MRFLVIFLLAFASARPSVAQDIRVDPVVTGLRDAWALEFLPGTRDLLITERGGRVLHLDAANATLRPLSGGPRVVAQGQGGLLDIAVAPDFATSGLVYLTWAGAVPGGSATHLGRARLDLAQARLTGLEVLHVAGPGVESGAHFGSRIVFADGHVFVGLGDRGDKNFGPAHLSQDLRSDNGSVLRLTMDGRVPADNPFVGQGSGAIWSYGHRNIQAMAVHPRTGAIWLAEHGEAGGDEVNIVTRGGNFGWPLATHGVSYRSGAPFSPPHQAEDGFVAPIHHWPAGREAHFPPSGMVFYTGDAFPQWRGHVLIGTLFHRHVGVFAESNGQITPVARLLDGAGHRIRDLAQGPDGLIYVLTDGAGGQVLRLSPR
jgi:aldose sugar dehydrogenase